MKIKTSQLSGPALDWAVGLAVHSTRWETIRKEMYWYPSVDWQLAGPLMEKYKVSLSRDVVYSRETRKNEDVWLATTGCIVLALEIGDDRYEGHTPLEAICRAIVASELGDEVDVPDELGGVE